MLNKEQIIKDAWEVWGVVPQMTQLSEEMAELIVEINKTFMRGKKDDSDLIEEFGDVIMMIEQASYILKETIPNFEQRLEEAMDFKWKRTAERIRTQFPNR